jgi:hypothetical protein
LTLLALSSLPPPARAVIFGPLVFNSFPDASLFLAVYGIAIGALVTPALAFAE